jgi:pimeloyl-ACP methyl ester carboxylesterase
MTDQTDRSPVLHAIAVFAFVARIAGGASVALLGSQTGVAISAPAPQLPTNPCQLEGVTRPTRCGVLTVLENPERPDGRRLAIRFAVIPASSSGNKVLDPIVVLTGGPGEKAIESASVYVGRLASLLSDRDLLLVDQRGTGQSAPLECHLFSSADPAASVRDFFPWAAVARCARELEKTADLTRYVSPYFASDLEQVRRALGYGRLNLFALSYGTQAAQAYLRRYPESVRTAYLGSPAPIDVGGPLDFAKTEQAALDRMFENCAAEAACHAAFPNLRSEFQQLVRRLDAGEVSVQVPEAADAFVLSRGRVASWVRSQLYRPRDAAALPWFLHRAYGGDWSPIVESMLSDARDVEQDLGFGLFFSITCSEEVPFVPEKDVVAATRDTFLGDYRLRQQQAACALWPKAKLPKGYRQPVKSSAPTLFVTGDLDGGTPLWYTDRVARGFSNHVTVVVHGQGHTEWNECVAGKYEQLVRSGSVRELKSPSCPPMALPSFKISPDSPAA